MNYLNKLANDVKVLAINLEWFFLDLVNFFENLAIFAEKSVAALGSAN